MPERVSLSHEKVIGAALDFVDEFGMDALTVRSLGLKLGAHHTALYRHFRNKNELVTAMFNFIIDQVSETLTVTPVDPRSRIQSISLAFRRALHEHPALVSTVVNTAGSEHTYGLQKVIVDAFRELGVPEDELAFRYQALESYVFGSSMFDFTGAPDHLKTRKERYQKSGISVFQVHTVTAEDVDAFNEKSFLVGLNLILAI